MGERKIYRWENRRAHIVERPKTIQLGLFDYVTLITVFAVWIFVLRVSAFYAITTSYCTEQLTNFSRNETLAVSVFEIGVYLSTLLGIYWVTVAISRFRTWQENWIWAIWHGTVLSTIFLLWAGCFSLTSSQHYGMPDGLLNTVPYIAVQQNGETVYEPHKDYTHKIGSWQLGEGYGDGYANKNCVWLEKGLVADHNIFKVEDYNAYLNDEYTRPFTFLFHDRKDLSIQNFMHEAGFSFFGKRPLDHMIAKQIYRPLTDEERARFLETQTCFANITNYGQRSNYCHHYWRVDIEKAWKAGLRP